MHGHTLSDWFSSDISGRTNQSEMRKRKRTAPLRYQSGARVNRKRPRNKVRLKKSWAFQRYNRTRNTYTANVGRHRRKSTLKTRVKALEAGSSKHWDYVSTGVESIAFNGTSLNPTKNSFSSILSIQGPLCDGTAGNIATSEQEQRMNDVIHVKSVRIRGMVSGVRPTETFDADAPGGPVTGGGPPPAPYTYATMTAFGAEMMKSLCSSRIYITLIIDKRPSTVGLLGQSVVNPLPTAPGETLLESVYEGNLATMGIESALRSYQSSRFKIVHQECITTSFQTPHKFFDIKYNINKTLKYVVPRTAVAPLPPPPNPPAFPYNYNLLCVVSCVSPVVPLPWASSLTGPSLAKKSSRTYFTDS